MSSSMWTFALLRDSSDLHIYKDLYGQIFHFDFVWNEFGLAGVNDGVSK